MDKNSIPVFCVKKHFPHFCRKCCTDHFLSWRPAFYCGGFPLSVVRGSVDELGSAGGVEFAELELSSAGWEDWLDDWLSELLELEEDSDELSELDELSKLEEDSDDELEVSEELERLELELSESSELGAAEPAK